MTRAPTDSEGKLRAHGEAELIGTLPHRIVDSELDLVPEGRGLFGDLTVAENLQLVNACGKWSAP